jgi:hypothetical protein
MKHVRAISNYESGTYVIHDSLGTKLIVTAQAAPASIRMEVPVLAISQNDGLDEVNDGLDKEGNDDLDEETRLELALGPEGYAEALLRQVEEEAEEEMQDQFGADEGGYAGDSEESVSLESLPRSDYADYLSGRDDIHESIVNLVEVGRWLQPPSANTRIRVIQANTPSFHFYVPPYLVDSAVVDRVPVVSTVVGSDVVDRVLVDSTVVDSALVDGGVVDSDACFSDFHACMFSGWRDNCPCFCSLCC